MPVGIDLLEIERLEAALQRRPGLAERLFTDGERAYAAARARPGEHLAARFCAKEAVAKALRLEAWSHQDIEVVGQGAATAIALHGSLAALGVHVDVSLTHTKLTAGAVAVVESLRDSTIGSSLRELPVAVESLRDSIGGSQGEPPAGGASKGDP